MSYESLDQSANGLLAKIRQAVFGLPHTPPKYAHPWSAYSPANFQKDDTVRNLVPAPATGAILSAADVPLPKDATAGDRRATKSPTYGCEHTPTIPELSVRDTGTASISEFEAVIIDLMAKQKRRKLATIEDGSPNSVQPSQLATGVDFQLAARLRSVSVLNRKVSKTGTSYASKRSGTNRPVRKRIAPTRRLGIEPPAVLRKKRLSAEIVYLKLALSRAEHKQARMLLAA